MTRYTQARTPAVRPVASAFMSGTYTCPELGRTCHRPGAYDAFELPSLMGSRLHYPDGRVVGRDQPTEPAA